MTEDEDSILIFEDNPVGKDNIRTTVESPGGGELPDDVGRGANDMGGTEVDKYGGGGSVMSTITTLM